MLPFLVPVLLTVYIQGVLKKLKNSGAKRLNPGCLALEPSSLVTNRTELSRLYSYWIVWRESINIVLTTVWFPQTALIQPCICMNYNLELNNVKCDDLT
jgi:hypothetical protein